MIIIITISHLSMVEEHPYHGMMVRTRTDARKGGWRTDAKLLHVNAELLGLCDWPLYNDMYNSQSLYLGGAAGR